MKINKDDLPPPRELTLPARRHFDRIARRIYGEGRWASIDVELLAVFAEALALYVECKHAVESHGVLVQGRTERELVRNPALTPMSQTRADLIRLAKAIPLAVHKPSDELDALLDAYV
ncbi:phage terminase, small subunit [Mycobacteroides abscessus 5S-0422]|uniref:Phage terminase, small subunit n=1 Tax=Mycobacteroides abscessus subsp. bolletii 1513 TaxID=1299321 RepID=X8DV51_9MYCO|nr:P27 family phage terminase small subunit [Mycobacteroides abscessus]EUA71420.1 phage terminase, small subunit [Mycobacteroides abscessus subsp. bolletii 1513]EIU15265.1 phage terminase, small subunit [Mycobacteroides abscessus 5S-0304]EIU16591.1 phage terminase, small subunit [Mycobacteroides abscessus 5S-0421]EIU18245.1 phage terminase, small subunit [Mycobacteroides abscessus 5S-0422]EIU27625.1 phage terminase, small subunit [Mycobacteroides abscessus 5S-0708]